MKRLAEIQARKLEIRELLEGTETVDLKALEAELKTLEAEETELRKRQEIAAGIKAGEIPARTVAQTVPAEASKPVETAETEKRGQALKEGRAVTIGSTTIVLPKHYASDIKPTFNEVSTLIDRVNIMNLPGGESFTQPYLVGTAAGDYKTEGIDYHEADTTFAYATISKAKVTAYSEDTEEVLKLPAAAYDALVSSGIAKSLRIKITKEILVGNGESNHLIGIFDDDARAIDAATDITVAEIDEDTLDEIIYTFGGDENVEDVAVLILNKLDLKAFAMLRDANGRKIYDIVNNGNSGTINSVPYIVNSACQAISNKVVGAGAYSMAYGPLSNYTLAIFSDIDLQRSYDFKFKSGHIAHRGSIFCGGNVTARNGFLRVKKG